MRVRRCVAGGVLALVFAASGVVKSSAQDVPELLVLSRSTPDTVTVSKGATAIDVRRQLIRVSIRQGTREDMFHVVMLLDPGSGLHWWSYQGGVKDNAQFDDLVPPFVVHFGDNMAVGFTFVSTVAVREVYGRHRDFAEIEKVALAELRQNARSLLYGAAPRVLIPVNVRTRLDEFLHKRNSALISPPPEIVEVHHDDNGWRIRLKGPNQDFAEVSLDNRYVVTAVRHPVKP